MIKSLSPYYVSTPWVNPLGGAVSGESYTLSIFAWNGDRFPTPITPIYQLTKENPESLTDSDKINISRLLSDFIDFEPQGSSSTGLIDGNNNWWVKTYVTYENDSTIQQEFYDILSLGYSYGNEGENITSITNDILLTTQDYKVNRNGVFTLPILAGIDNSELYKIRVENDGGIVESLECVDTTRDNIFHFQPSGYKTSVLYSEKANDGTVDFGVVRASEQTRINEDGDREVLANNVPSIDYMFGGCPILYTPTQETNLIHYSKDLF